LKLKLPKKSNLAAEFISDNSSECDADTAFLITPLSVKYLDDAKSKGVTVFVGANELKNIFDLSSIKIIGITGTNGKTTTAAAIYSLLLDIGKKVGLQGTRGLFINDKRVEEKSLTTPMQLNTFSNILSAIEQGCEYFVMEVSSHAIAQKRIEGLNFALKIITNITQDHLDFHKTFENYRDTKNEFLADESLKLINIDDENVVFNKKNAKTYGLEKHADYKIGAYSLNEGIFAVLENGGDNHSFHASMAGVFNIYNLTASIAAVHILTGESLEEICSNVENFGGVSGRMEIVSISPFVVIDFAHTPDGIAKVLEALGGSKITVVFGAGGDRDKGKRPLMGKEAAMRAAKVIVTSDNPRSENPQEIIDGIVAGIDDKSKVSVVIDRYEAIKKAIMEQKEGEIVAILGKGDESSQIFKDKTIHFDDREVAREILKQK
jgi:UDP-N-acetylmuramoyl-L-alanyl-D-glutamate--2,6-diaminopimelate ligase